ncbi:spermidine synthase [Caerostris extrusa]|uniref:Spermidine synthase n=1 Tax=Caerostris extrusa TaxID=172846 RepID=A0AAV4XBD3_CAEEX|nr:spermidine synthase [Caerostris extrusa]
MSILPSYSVQPPIEFGMDAFKKGWFTETGTLNGDQALSIQVDEVLYHEKSKYQDILVFNRNDNILAFKFPSKSKKVLIIGGGDGGAVREAVKHPLVESVTMCEIDEKVVEVSKKYLPFMAKGFDSPKLTLFFGDGAEFIRNHQNEFDVIITDSSDPKGPAICLFQKPYYESLKKALKPGGIIASQGESFWFDSKLLSEMIKMCREIFPVVDYGSSYVPTYPGGQIGYLCCSMSPDTNFRYYTPDIHQAAFALPLAIAETLDLKWEMK